MPKQPESIILSTHVNGLWVTRALSGSGVQTTVLPMERTDLARYSRHADAVQPVFSGDVRRLFTLLQEQADTWRGRVLVPTGDLALEALSRYREQLSRDYLVAAPEWESVQRFLRKDQALQLAAECRVPTPENYGALDEAMKRIDEIAWPAVIKPNDSQRFRERFGAKVFVARDAAEFRVFAGKVLEAGIDVRVMELIPGPDTLSYNYTAFYSKQGSRIAECAIHKLRKSPPFFGIGRVVETMDDERTTAILRERIDAMVAKSGLHGPVSAEFKRHPVSGEMLFIELNARCSFVQQLALKRGVNYARMAYEEAASGSTAPGEPRPWNGAMIHLHADLLNGWFHRKKERLPLRALAKPYLGRMSFAVFRWSDPAPFVVEWGRTFTEAIRFAANAQSRNGFRRRLETTPADMMHAGDGKTREI